MFINITQKTTSVITMNSRNLGDNLYSNPHVRRSNLTEFMNSAKKCLEKWKSNFSILQLLMKSGASEITSIIRINFY